MKIINYFFIAYFISILPANAQLFGGQIKTKNPLLNQYPAGSIFCNGPTAIVDVINPTTGKTWMDRNLGATQAATSASDASAYGDLYQWGRGNDGHQCRNSATTTTLSATDQPVNGKFILYSNSIGDWRSPQNNNLWQGVNGLNNPCPSGYRIPTKAELDADKSSWPLNSVAGAFASPIKFTAGGGRLSATGNNGNIESIAQGGVYWSSSISGTSSLHLEFGTLNVGLTVTITRSDGNSIRCIKDASAIPATVDALNCGSTSFIGTLTSGTAASGVSASVPYTGGNGGSYATQTISSTGVTGLTATITSGILANGSGSLSLAISGIPGTSGTASFALNIGGQTCSINISVANLTSLYPTGSIFCNGPTAVVDVINPTTGKTWMDRNLGALQIATNINNAVAYGDLYQWGRGNDGHQCRNSATTTTRYSVDYPNGNFVYNAYFTQDWLATPNVNLWQGVNGVNNPCPLGYRLPTVAEFNTERGTWGVNTDAFVSPLKFTNAGSRWGDAINTSENGLGGVGVYGSYWSSTINDTESMHLSFQGSLDNVNMQVRGTGMSVRCIKN